MVQTGGDEKIYSSKKWTGMVKHDYLFIWLIEDVTTRISDRATD